ncbi:MAG: pirin family protein, partial [Candidatus Thiodiazotropha taylori]|nr:pirin family protein [Candidatus Thiodiazotropha taylori]MCW4232981.1 pirin family protein [Candidatus Thiodiazotropha taylori]
MSEVLNKTRSVQQVLTGQETADGAGVRLTRLIGGPQLMQLDPFLLLDDFRSDDPDDYIGGFPPHPHRGFETVTYLMAGKLEHRDNAGHTGILQTGGVQWMTAGRGVIHSEMPQQQDGLLAGFQLWVNLPARDKMTEPRYQEFDQQEIP